MEDPVGSIPITRSLMIMVVEAEESRRCVVAAVQAGSSPVDHPVLSQLEWIERSFPKREGGRSSRPESVMARSMMVHAPR